MKQGVRSGLASSVLVLLVAVALAAAGWAHRLPASAGSPAVAELAAFVASGGSAADLCGTAGGDAAERDHCPVCTVPGALPQPVTAQAALPVARTADPAAFARRAAPSAACHPAWNGRAPPVV